MCSVGDTGSWQRERGGEIPFPFRSLPRPSPRWAPTRSSSLCPGRFIAPPAVRLLTGRGCGSHAEVFLSGEGEGPSGQGWMVVRPGQEKRCPGSRDRLYPPPCTRKREPDPARVSRPAGENLIPIWPLPRQSLPVGTGPLQFSSARVRRETPPEFFPDVRPGAVPAGLNRHAPER